VAAVLSSSSSSGQPRPRAARSRHRPRASRQGPLPRRPRPTTSKPTTPTPVKEFSEAHRCRTAPISSTTSASATSGSRWDDAIASLQQYLTDAAERRRGVIESRIANFTQRREARRAAPPSTATPPTAAALSRWCRAGAAATHRRFVVVASASPAGGGAAPACAHLAYNDLDMSCPKQVCDGTKQTLRDEASIGRGSPSPPTCCSESAGRRWSPAWCCSSSSRTTRRWFGCSWRRLRRAAVRF